MNRKEVVILFDLIHIWRLMMRKKPCLIAGVLYAIVLFQPLTGEGALDQKRIDELATCLPERPQGLGEPCRNRGAWECLASWTSAQSVLSRAEETLGNPLPESPDDLFLDFSRTGNRTRWQRVAADRRGRVVLYCLAECLENQGRFIPALEEVVRELCAEMTWVMPAHDRTLANFKGEQIDVDLGSSAVAWNLATARHLLDDKLSEEIRELILQQCQGKILAPVKDMVTGKRDPNWWLLTTNNWNAVCLAGVVGTALALEPCVRERALFVAAAEAYIQNFLKGFTQDGYCSEGVGYWNYGYGHFVLLADTLLNATSGKLNLYDMEGAAAPAAYGCRIEIMHGVCPAFADCGVRARPSLPLVKSLRAVYGDGPGNVEPQDQLGGSLFQSMLYAFPSKAKASKSLNLGETLEIRDWFEEAGILICRPGPETSCRMAAAMKAGHNAEHHNHNDVGSFLVVVGDRPILVDPGSETYTARTFSSKRYESNVLNSFGHPVPVVAGQLQRTGKDACGQVLRAEFEEDRDLLEMEMASAYKVEGLKSLRRTFLYERSGQGRLQVTDHVKMSFPGAFETALLTLGAWVKEAEDLFLAHDFEHAVRVRIDTEGQAFETEMQEIHEDCHGVPKRLAIRLAHPVQEGRIHLAIEPVVEEETAGVLLNNGGFEKGSWHWNLKGDQAHISEEQAFSGRYSLKIVDDRDDIGSDVWSSKMLAEAGAAYRIQGRVFPVSGDGVGIYVYFLDEEGQSLNEKNHRGHIESLGSLGGDSQTWESFQFEFVTPQFTRWIQVWIHSYNASKVVAFLDDLEMVPGEAGALGEAKQLFNGKDLDGFYSFLKGLGKNTDPEGVFTVSNGILRISGKTWGCITTHEEYENYHLVVEYKWGEDTHEPRVDRARDCGVLLHSMGEDGGYSGTWMHSIECQMIEGGTGDFIVVGDGTDTFSITCTVAAEKCDGCHIFQENGTPVTLCSGRVNWHGRDPQWRDVKGFRGSRDVENPLGQWNRLECLCHGDRITLFLNGVLVNCCTKAQPSKGRIQIQSEGAEVFFRRIDLLPVKQDRLPY